MLDQRMRNHQSNHRLIFALVLGLLIAQWLVITHIHDPANKAADSLCAVCLSGEQLGHGLANKQFKLSSPAPAEPVCFELGNLVLARPITFFHSRAPPLFP